MPATRVVTGAAAQKASKHRALVAGIFGAYYHLLPIDGNREAGYAYSERIKAKPRGKLRIAYAQKNLGYNKLRESFLAIGDIVEFEFDEKNRDTAIIVAVDSRRNALHRASFGRQQCLAANIDGVLVMASIRSPEFNLGFVERCLAEIEIAKIPAALVVNKYDLVEQPREADEEILQYYASIGIPVFRESVLRTVSIALKQKLQSGTWLLLGQSGTGKSTLLNRILGENLQTTGEISLIDKGRHTTTNPALYFSNLHANLVLIDVPGLREFGMHHRDAHELRGGFPEFANFTCRFENCLHLKEPGCGVKAALEEGDIPRFRYRCYVSMLDTVAEEFKPRKGDYWRGVRD